MFQINDTIGGYRILDLLGSGGMGAVYRVRNVLTEREEAMKVLLPDLHATPELMERFAREIRIQASLEHPHIAGLRTAIRSENQLLMIIELVDGMSLDRYLRAAAVPHPQAVIWMYQILSALSYAHERGVIHRDLKPANIMLTAAGFVKLTDFGVASMAAQNRLTRTGVGIGSLHYMSPEQIHAAQVDARSDIYSLGITFYQMLSGRRPFERASDYELMKAHLEEMPPPLLSLNPALPPELQAVVTHALAKNPADRYQSAQEFAKALEMATGVSGARIAPIFPAPNAEPVPLPNSATPTPMQTEPGRLPSHLQAPGRQTTFSHPAGANQQTPASNLDPTRVDRVRTELAQYVGPMARILVNRGVKKARTLQQLYDILADEISNPEERRRFLARRPQ